MSKFAASQMYLIWNERNIHYKGKCADNQMKAILEQNIEMWY